MTDLTAMLNALRRPKILIRAARAGVADYRRDRDLKRLLKAPKTAAPQHAIGSLLAEEHRLEAGRAAGEATYNLQRHVAVLTAILAEMRSLPPTPERRLSGASPLASAAAMGSVAPRGGTAPHRIEPGREPGRAPRRRPRRGARRRARRARRRLVRLVGRDHGPRDPRRALLRRGRGRVRARRPDPGRVRRLLSRLRQPRALAGLPLPHRPRPFRRGRVRRLRGGQPALRPAAGGPRPPRRRGLDPRLPFPADGPGDAPVRLGRADGLLPAHPLPGAGGLRRAAAARAAGAGARGLRPHRLPDRPRHRELPPLPRRDRRRGRARGRAAARLRPHAQCPRPSRSASTPPRSPSSPPARRDAPPASGWGGSSTTGRW